MHHPKSGPEPGHDSVPDPLYDQAVTLVRQRGSCSVALVQRHLRVGYNQALRLIMRMEREGVVSLVCGSGGRREVLGVGEAVGDFDKPVFEPGGL
ncbi:DNA translocase FtsK [Caldimonas tepidiphila]|uniref:DNA translocase FtsK n=1 Tax=Caldimonas tepidiphila TaxID=2315841 RepID=UPI000E5A524D